VKLASSATATARVTIDTAACAGQGSLGTGGNGGNGGNSGGAGTSNGNVIPPRQPYAGPAIDTSNSDRCDFLDPAVCLQPWPNDYFTVADSSTDTGRRLNLQSDSMPKNQPLGAPVGVTPINPAEYDSTPLTRT